MSGKRVVATPATATPIRPPRRTSPNLHGPGTTLPAATRAHWEARFGHTFADVRIHDDATSARAATSLHAQAFTDGRDIGFARGRYRPGSPAGDRLLAHELAHIVQRRQPGPTADAEPRADAAASQALQGRTVDTHHLGSAPAGVLCEDEVESDLPRPQPVPLTFTPFQLPWNVLTPSLPGLPPPMASPGGQPTSLFGIPPLTLGGTTPGTAGTPGGFGSFTPAQLPGITEPPLSTMPTSIGPLLPKAEQFTPPPLPPAQTTAGSGADMPSRVGVADVGQLSFGLRLGLPVAPEPIPGTPPEHRLDGEIVPGAGPSPRAVTEYQLELLDMSITGKVPTGFDAIDKGALFKTGFSIISTYIIPDVMKSLAASVAGGPGADYHLDFSVIGFVDGAGITFTMSFDKAPKPAPRSEP